MKTTRLTVRSNPLHRNCSRATNLHAAHVTRVLSMRVSQSSKPRYSAVPASSQQMCAGARIASALRSGEPTGRYQK